MDKKRDQMIGHKKAFFNIKAETLMQKRQYAKKTDYQFSRFFFVV